MRVGPGVEDDTIRPVAGDVQDVDECALVVGLLGAEADAMPRGVVDVVSPELGTVLVR